MIPYSTQQIDADDLSAVAQVLKSTLLTQGPKVPEFENAVAEICNTKYAIATNSATSALHIACLALEVGPGDIVWTSPISFVASSNCALYCGATIDFIDIDLTTGNLSTQLLEIKLKEASLKKALPKVVIPVHFAGHSCDMEQIFRLAQEYGFHIIEDASHAIGASYKNGPVGSCSYSDITIFSFHPVKIITSGEGGMALTNQPKLARKMQMLRSHGITSDPNELTEPSHGPWYYQQQILGFNYRMTDIHAALGISQLNKLQKFVAERNDGAAFYNKYFKGSSQIVPLEVNNNCYSSYHLYVIRIPNLTINERRTCIEYLRNKGISAHLHYIPIYLQPYYLKLGFSEGYCKNAETYYNQAITLPLFPGLTREQQVYVLSELDSFLNQTKQASR